MVMTPAEYYAAANLRDNPFRSNPTFAVDPRAGIWVGYEKEKTDLVKFLKRSLADQVGNANWVMLYGGYGTGKSHALVWAQNLILHEEKDTFDSVCYFIPTLRKDKGKFTFAGAFKEDLMVRSNLLGDVQAYQNFLGECIISYRNANGLGHDVANEIIIDKLIPPVELKIFAKNIYTCQSAEALGKILAPTALADYQAMIIFTRLANLFSAEMAISDDDVRRFKKATYLFIDELDDLKTAPVKEAREVNDILRHIFDNCPNCFCMVVSFSGEISEMTVIFMDYVLSRIQRQIELLILDKNDAVKFVREILNSNRLNPDDLHEFFPFEKDAINGIAAQLTEITPRKIVNAMQQVIEEVRLAGHNPTEEAVNLDYLDREGILDEVLGDGGIA